MSECCGLFGRKVDEHKIVHSNSVPIIQQPSPHPGIAPSFEKPYNQPSISPPPPAHNYTSSLISNGPLFPGHQPHFNYSSSSTPVPNQFGALTPSPPPGPAYQKNSFNVNGSFGSMSGASIAFPPHTHSRVVSGNSIAPIAGIGQITYPNKPLSSLDDGKMSVSIDFGTTFSGVAYGSSRIAGGKVQQILNWPGSSETFRKIPTCLLYDDMGRVLAWGLEAKNATPIPGTYKCQWFKLFLEPHALRDSNAVDPRLPQIPTGKKALDLIIDFLTCLYEYAKEQITREIGAVADLDSADVWLTVPAAWDAKGCEMMREAAIAAGVVQSARAGDKEWRDRLRIITEPEAAAVHCASLTDLHKLKPSQNFMICDAGGGTVDLAIYKIIGQMANLEIAEMFQELVKTLLADHPTHLDPASLASFMHSFSSTDKLEYTGESDDDNMFHFTCFNVDDPHDPSVGLINGELVIPGNLLRREVFDPIVQQVIDLIEEQAQKIDQRIDALLLVGGFAGSNYLFKRVEDQFASRIRVIARPTNADTATARGAAQYGLARRPLVSSVIAPRSYIMRAKLPADAEDQTRRPAYIKLNDAGVPICENRLQYLVQKGAILRKGQRVSTKFCKFSQSSQDSVFVAILYTSDGDKIMRYTDEGETMELCKWTVDLSALPTFRQFASMPHSKGFYTEFELGLELDSAEVRGVLLYEGREWGRVVFDFLK